MQRVWWLPQRYTDHVPDIHRDWRRSYVDARSREYYPARARAAWKRTRPVEVGGTGRRAQQLSLLQRLHTRMSVERESGVAQSRNALRATPSRRFAAAGAFFQQCRFVRPNRLHHSMAGKRNSRSCAYPRVDGENARNFSKAFFAALHAQKIRSLV